MYYQQDTEVTLLVQFLKRLDDKRVIDVGAERGNFVQALLESGAEAIYAVEPYPPNVTVLRDRFKDQAAVRILEMALGEHERTVTLHIIKDKTRGDRDSYHSIIPFNETPMLRPVGKLTVQCRTLAWLIDQGEIPPEVGILKIDAERSDFAILHGMGKLAGAVVMVEFWDELPETVGATPYHLTDVIRFMQARGYSNFALVKRYDEFEVIQLNSHVTRPGEWGNVFFFQDRVFEKLSPVIYTAIQETQTRLTDKALLYRTECEKRMVVIEEQSKVIAKQVKVKKPADNEKTLAARIRSLRSK